MLSKNPILFSITLFSDLNKSEKEKKKKKVQLTSINTLSLCSGKENDLGMGCFYIEILCENQNLARGFQKE